MLSTMELLGVFRAPKARHRSMVFIGHFGRSLVGRRVKLTIFGRFFIDFR